MICRVGEAGIRVTWAEACIRLVAMSVALDDDADEGVSLHPIKGHGGLETS